MLLYNKIRQKQWLSFPAENNLIRNLTYNNLSTYLVKGGTTLGFCGFDNGLRNEFDNFFWVVILLAFRYGDYCTVYTNSCCRGRKGNLRQGSDKIRALAEPCLETENVRLIELAEKDSMIYK